MVLEWSAIGSESAFLAAAGLLVLWIGVVVGVLALFRSGHSITPANTSRIAGEKPPVRIASTRTDRAGYFR